MAHKGRIKSDRVRPTTAKVRSAVFNIWRELVQDCSWLDVCAGSGAMGAAALGWGAKRVVGIEISPSLCRLIQQEWQKRSQPHQSWRVIRGDVLKVLPQLTGERFDLVYFDPPYASDLYGSVLGLLPTVIHPDSLIAVEHRVDRPLPEHTTALAMYDQRRYGDTMLTFYGVSLG